MRVNLFDYDLPQNLIASAPANPRDSARLLHVPFDGSFADRHVGDLPQLLRAGDVMVFNDTKVIPARLFGMRGEVRVEILLHRFMGDGCWTCFAKPAKRLKDGHEIVFAPDFTARVVGRAEDGQVMAVIANWGMPVTQGPNVKRVIREMIERPAYKQALAAEEVEYKAAA